MNKTFDKVYFNFNKYETQIHFEVNKNTTSFHYSKPTKIKHVSFMF